MMKKQRSHITDYLALTTLRSLNDFGTILSSTAILLHIVLEKSDAETYLLFISKNALSIILLFIGGRLADYSKKFSINHVAFIFISSGILYFIIAITNTSSSAYLIGLIVLSICLNSIVKPYIAKLNIMIIADNKIKKFIGISATVKNIIILPSPLLAVLIYEYHGIQWVLIIDALTYFIISIGVLLFRKYAFTSLKSDITNPARISITQIKQYIYKQLFHATHFELLYTSIIKFSSSIIEASIVIYIIQHLQLDNIHFGNIQSICHIAAILSGLLFSFFICRLPIKNTLIPFSAILGVLYIFLSGAHNILWLYIVIICIEFLEKQLLLILRSNFIYNSKKSNLGQCISLFKSISKFACLLGSIFGYIAIKYLNIPNLFTIVGSTLIISSIGYFLLIKRSNSIEVIQNANG